MQVGNFTATADDRKNTFDIPFNASQLKLSRTSQVSALDNMDVNVPETLTITHSNLLTRRNGEVSIRTSLGAMALVAALGEKNPDTGAVIVPMVPIYETFNTTTGLFQTIFTIQLTPGGALHTDGDNKLSLLLDDAVPTAVYSLSLHENPVALPFYNEVRSLPTLQGPKTATVQANLFRHIVFPNNSDIVIAIELLFSNGQRYTYTLVDLLREMYEAMPVLGYSVPNPNNVGFNDDSIFPRAVFAQDCALVVLDCSTLTEVKFHTDGSILPVTTFGVNALPQ